MSCSWLDRFVSAGHCYLLQYKYYHQILVWLLSNIMRLKAIWLYASGCSYITIKLALLSHNSIYIASCMGFSAENEPSYRAQYSLIATPVFLLQDLCNTIYIMSCSALTKQSSYIYTTLQTSWALQQHTALHFLS